MPDDEMTNVILKDLSFRVMSAVFEVHNTLGPGFLEKVYENALLRELQLRGIEAEAQKEISVDYKGEKIGTYLADLLVNNEMIVELKSVERLNRLHVAQVLNYLKATGLRLGLLINFGTEKVEHKRLVL